MAVNISDEEIKRGQKAIEDKDWHTYADVMFDNAAKSGPESPLKSALNNGPSTPEEKEALLKHIDDKDSAALSLEFILGVAAKDNEQMTKNIRIIAGLLVEHKQKAVMHEIIQKVKASVVQDQ